MAELSVDTLIKDRYRLKEFKGSGSFGEVWLAQDEILDIEVAIKVYISLDQRGIKEFQNEYKAAYGLHHPNLLVTDYFDVWEQRPFLVMKYCRDGSVASRAGEMTEPELWRFIRDVASGLAYLHGQEPDPIVHQDIKPDNILVDEHGNYLITDFGISRRIRSTMRKQSRRTSTAGAVAYMGPERFSENPTPVMASDIWSLGASIYELATGYLPFDGLGGGHQANGARRPRLQAPWSADLSDTIRACLAQETWDRPRAADLATYAAAKVEGRRPAAPWVINSSDPSSSSGSTGPSNDPSQIKTSLHNPWPYAQQSPEPQPPGRRTVAQGQEVVDPVNVEAPERKRHGFVSFWLYFCLCCNALAAIIFFFYTISDPPLWELPMVAFGSLMSVYGMLLLLNWRKEGFWLLVVSTALVSITIISAFNGFVATLFLGLLSTAVSMAVHYGILCIERNGVSTWKWLRYGGPLPALFMLIIMVCVSLFLFFFVGIKRSQLAAEENFENASKGYVEITRMQFGNCDNEGNMLTDYGGTLNASEMRYLKGRFHCTSLADESETVTFKVKIIKPDGTLMSGSSSPSGFTNSMTTTILPTTSSVTLNGWGSSSGGSFVAGDYQYEVWVGNRLIYETTVTIQGAARPAALQASSHLTVNGKSSTVSVNFTASGGNKQMTVSCPSGSWSTWGIPSFCSVTNKTSTSFTFRCDANTGSSSRSDYMKIIAGSDEVRINISQAAPSSQSNQATRLTVDGKTSVSTSFNASGGTQTFSISTDASSWETWGVPSFCSVTNKTSTSFTLRCNANTSSSARSDYMKIKAGGKEVRIDIAQRGNTSQATRLTVDGKTAVSTSFSASGGTETFYISTDASSWETWGVPSFCSVTNKTSTSFTLRCDANTSTSSRSDYMKIKAGGKEVRIDITQSGKSSSSNKSATISRCWLEHNVTYNGNKGMKTHIDVTINGMKGKTAEFWVFFYKDDDFTAVKNSSGRHVHWSYDLNANYESTRWSDAWIFLSYDWMREQLQGVAGTYAIDVVIWDDNDNQLTRSDNHQFTVTF